MSKPAVIQADFSDFRQVKSRKVAQLICEIPLEALPAAMAALGWPNPETSLPVAIARLDTPQPQQSQPEPAQRPHPESEDQGRVRKHFRDMPRSQQAALKLKDPEFCDWLVRAHLASLPTDVLSEPNEVLKYLMGVTTKRQLDTTDHYSQARWDALLTDYDTRHQVR